jgi:hypothetical protein
MWRRLLGVVLAILMATLLAAPAAARGPVQRRGPCDIGTTRWVLTVGKGPVAGTLRVRFVVRGATPADVWQILLSDGNRRLPAVDRTVGPGGVLRLMRVIRNRVGRDRIMVFATQTQGEVTTCSGHVTF